jgi:hypothetical protein
MPQQLLGVKKDTGNEENEVDCQKISVECHKAINCNKEDK